MGKIFKDVNSCENEVFVKQYECTTFKSKLLGINSKGTLGVTNKRVIFNAKGESLTGNSIIQNEVPVEDISGIGFYKGTYFNFFYLLFGGFLTFFLTPIITGLVLALASAIKADEYSWGPNVTVMWFLAIAFTIAAAVIKKQNVLRTVFFGAAASTFMLIGGMSNLFDVFLGGGYGSGFGSILLSGLESPGISLLAGLVCGIMFLVSLFLYSRRETMTMSINSKGGGNTPIYISGIRGLGASNQAAPKALEAEPSHQAEKLIEELGALVTDLQKMGDLAIEKWS